MSRLLDLKECAERTGTTVRWWRRAIFEGRVPIVKLGHLVRIDERDLEDLVESWRVPAKPGHAPYLGTREASKARQVDFERPNANSSGSQDRPGRAGAKPA